MAMGMCRRPLKRFQQLKQSDKGPRWVKDKAVFWCKHCNTDFSVVVRKVPPNPVPVAHICTGRCPHTTLGPEISCRVLHFPCPAPAHTLT